jgi:hypothetical protein
MDISIVFLSSPCYMTVSPCRVRAGSKDKSNLCWDLRQVRDLPSLKDVTGQV